MYIYIYIYTHIYIYIYTHTHLLTLGKKRSFGRTCGPLPRSSKAPGSGAPVKPPPEMYIELLHRIVYYMYIT